jgi:hypothetical protein
MGINIAPLIAGALLGGIGIAPPPAFGGGVLYCNIYGCTSSPYFRPPIVPTSPPVVIIPPPLAIPPAPRPVVAPPPPLRVDPPPRVDPTPRQADPPPRLSKREQQDKANIEQDILAFCDAHPDEHFCGRLGEWLRAHPNGRK